MFRFEPRVEGVTDELLRTYETIGTSTIGHLTDFGYLRGARPLFRPVRMAGNAVTVRIPHLDGSAIRRALGEARAGDILVIDMSGDDDRACWGELRTYAAINKGLAGVVVSGCVTDAAAVAGLGLPVFSKGISALTTRSLELEGEVNVPVGVFGVSVSPGDLIVGDDDGVFALSPSLARELGEKALARQEAERETRARLRPGLSK